MTLDRDEAASLLYELARLRKNEGFIPRRLTQVQLVSEVLRSSPEDSFERMKSRFLSALHTLDESEANLLLDVFALSDETAGVTRLMERRRIHGDKIGLKHEAVADREQAALQHLHSRLVRGTYAQSPMVLDVPEMHGGIIYEFSSTLIIVENRLWKQTNEYYRIGVLEDDLWFLRIGRSYDGVVTTASDSDFIVETERVEGSGWADIFRHVNDGRTRRSPMKKGQVYDLRFTISPNGDRHEQEPLKLASRAFHHRSLMATIQVAFVGERPSSIWTFDNLSPYERPTKPDDDSLTSLDKQGVASIRLRDIHGGLFTGIGWS